MTKEENALIEKIDAAGFIVVPKEPSQKMLDAALHDYLDYERQGPTKPAWNGRTMWNAMIAAAAEENARSSDAETWCVFCKKNHVGGARCMGHHP